MDEPISKKIEPVLYSNSIVYFRGWMDRLLATSGKTFEVKRSEQAIKYQIEYYPPAKTETREVWNVMVDPTDSRIAMILATESQPNMTTVEFLDGLCYEKTAFSMRFTRGMGFYPTSASELKFSDAHLASYEPIGDDFIKIAEWIKNGLNENQLPSKIPQEPETRARGGSLPVWWPRQNATKLRWKMLYKQIRPLYEKGMSFTEIHKATGIRRQDIPRIVEWAQKSPEAHDR